MNKLTISLVLSVILYAHVYSTTGIVKVTGETDYFSPSTESPAQAIENAIREAQIEALKTQFGVIVGEHSSVFISSDNGVNRNIIHSLGESDVNGEWIRDLHEPEISEPVKVKGGSIYKVKVYGEAREIPQNRIELDCKLLYNGTDPNKNQVRSGEYHFGDECYLYFRSPADGWVSVFLADDDDEGTMQCMLPYDEYSKPAYPVKSNTDYIFFSRELADDDCAEFATRMIMESRKAVDYNVFYILFSPHEFGAQRLQSFEGRKNHEQTNVSPDLMPRETNFKSFHKWLGKQRKKDPDFQVIKYPVTIRK